MGRSGGFLALLLLAAAGAVVWLLVGPQRHGGPGDGAVGSRAEEAAPDLAQAPEGAPAEGVRPTGALAARRIERRGTGSLRARIADVKEVPLAGASFHVRGTGHAGEEVALQVVSAGDGTVDLSRVPAGEGYVVRVEVAGEPPVTLPDVEVRASRQLDLGTILVGARATLSGTVVDERGAPVPRADVRAMAGYDSFADVLGNFFEMFTRLGREPTALAQATSAGDGTFVLKELPAGSLLLRASAPGRQAAFARVRMTAEGPAQGPVTLRVERGAPLAGVVVESTGTPVPGATVALMSEEGGGGMANGDDANPLDFLVQRVFATTDAKGAFAFVVAPEARRLRLVVEAAGFPTSMSGVLHAGTTDARVVVARGATLEVLVVDETTGRPVVGAQVVAAVSEKGGFASDQAGGGILYGATGDTGLVALPTGPGRVEMLMVSHEGHAPLMHSRAQDAATEAVAPETPRATPDVPQEIPAGAVVRATVRLASGVRLVGKVTDREGTPIPGAEVKPVSLFGGGAAAAARTDAEGRYVLPGLTGLMAGQAQAMVRFSAPGFVPATEQVTIDAAVLAAGESTKDVRLQRAAVLRGKVLDEEGRPVAGARVKHTGAFAGGFDLQSMMGGGGVLTDATGAYVLTEVPPAEGKDDDVSSPSEGEEPTGGMGRFLAMTKMRVTASAEGFVPGRTEVLRFAAGAQVDVPPIRLSRGVVVRGTVRLPGGAVAAAARVEARLEPQTGPNDLGEMIQTMAGMAGQRATRTGSDGTFEVAGLAPGKLTVVVRHEGFAPSRRVVTVGTQPLTVDVTLRPGADLTGRVVGPEGQAVPGASVAVQPAAPGEAGEEAWVEAVTVRTDTQGRFALLALPPGAVTLRVSAAGHQRQDVTGVPGGAPLDVRLAASQGKRSRADVQKEVQEVSMKFATADADERAALQQRLQELMEEMQEAEK